jgi:thiol-disulfide isomerase/thioredoxin
MGCPRSISLSIGCAALFIGGLVALTSAAPRTPQSVQAENLDGKSLDPFKATQGRVLVLLFIRTDCPISNRYAPVLQELSEAFQGKANFWLVYPDAAESAAKIRAHLAEFHYSIPALRDIHRTLVNRAQATITPEAAVFDASGKLVYHGRIDNWFEDFGRARAAATTHELAQAIRNTVEGRMTAPDHANAVGCYISDLQ